MRPVILPQFGLYLQFSRGSPVITELEIQKEPSRPRGEACRLGESTYTSPRAVANQRRPRRIFGNYPWHAPGNEYGVSAQRQPSNTT